MYWTPRGRVLGGGIPLHGGDFLEIWVLNTGFLCIIKFKLTSTLAPKTQGIYDLVGGGGGTVSVVVLLSIMYWTPRGRVWEGGTPPPVRGDFWKFGY